jgi:uncharacterized protein YndB with AHSA1/START domain
MAEIRHNVVIKATPEKVYKAVTTQEGIESWWCKNTTAKPEVGFVNIFTFGKDRSEMKVTELAPNKGTEWKCIKSTDEWTGTKISFDLEEKSGDTILRFAHEGWKAPTDMYAVCNYHWALFMKSLKSFCETGAGTPS